MPFSLSKVTFSFGRRVENPTLPFSFQSVHFFPSHSFFFRLIWSLFIEKLGSPCSWVIVILSFFFFRSTNRICIWFQSWFSVSASLLLLIVSSLLFSLFCDSSVKIIGVDSPKRAKQTGSLCVHHCWKLNYYTIQRVLRITQIYK